METVIAAPFNPIETTVIALACGERGRGAAPSGTIATLLYRVRTWFDPESRVRQLADPRLEALRLFVNATFAAAVRAPKTSPPSSRQGFRRRICGAFPALVRRLMATTGRIVTSTRSDVGHEGRGLRLLRRVRFLAALSLGLIILLPLRLMTRSLGGRSPSRFSSLFHRVLLRGLRIEVEIEGSFADDALVVANHISWVDILVLGTSIPSTFIAKAEVRGWPLLGMLARLNPTIFVRRDSRAAVPGQVGAIAAALERGPVVLFPEGTTGDGADVLPFRPALFAAAAGRSVQPVTLCYHPADRAWQLGELAAFAWDGDKAFWPHVLAVCGGRPIRCRVLVHSPVPTGQDDRKALAVKCRAIIRASLGERTSA